jgi:hypothetical protein
MVYVDPLFEWPAELVSDPQARRLTQKYGKWSHMFADTEAELVAFGRKIGMRPQWLQKRGTSDAHFDLVPTKRRLAVQLGAREITQLEAVNMRREKRGQAALQGNLFKEASE